MAPNENQTAPQPSQTPQPQQPQSAIKAPDPIPSSPTEQASATPAAQAPAPSIPAQPNRLLASLNNSLVLSLIIATVVFVLVTVGAVYAYQHPKEKATASSGTAQIHSNLAAPKSTTPSSCAPVSAASLDKISAEKAYQNFVKAVASQNQTCADSLSSSFFLSQAKDEFGAPDRKWITASPQGIRPIWKDLAQLPTTLIDANFTQSDYTRPIVAQQAPNGLQAQSSDSSVRSRGVKLSYPVDLSKYTGSKTSKWQVSVSFVLQSGKIQVDDLVIEPQK